MKKVYRHRYPTICPKCESDLCQENAVEIAVSMNDHVSLAATRLDRDGWLVDVDKVVANGYHAGTVCFRCGTDLGDSEIFEE